MGGVSSCGNELDLSLFDVQRVEYQLSLTVHGKSGSKIELNYTGVNNDLDAAVDECEAAVSTLVGFLDSRS